MELSKIETLEEQGLHFGIGPKDRGLKKLKKLIELIQKKKFRELLKKKKKKP